MLERGTLIEFSEPTVPFWGISFPGWNLSDHERPNPQAVGMYTTTGRKDGQLPLITNEPHDSAPRQHPAFTLEESIVMRAFSAGKSDKQVCSDLHIPVQSFYRLRRDLMEKTGTRDPVGLHVWALRQREGGDSRGAERNYKWRSPK